MYSIFRIWFACLPRTCNPIPGNAGEGPPNFQSNPRTRWGRTRKLPSIERTPCDSGEVTERTRKLPSLLILIHWCCKVTESLIGRLAEPIKLSRDVLRIPSSQVGTPCGFHQAKASLPYNFAVTQGVPSTCYCKVIGIVEGTPCGSHQCINDPPE